MESESESESENQVILRFLVLSVRISSVALLVMVENVNIIHGFVVQQESTSPSVQVHVSYLL